MTKASYPYKVEHSEEWLPIRGWEGLYSVSSLGRIRSEASRLAARKIIRRVTKRGRDGYLGLTMMRGGKRQDALVATLVMEAFVGPKPDGLQINHIDGNRENNALANLEYVTGDRNQEHATENRLHPFGTRHHAAKLTEGIVRLIRRIDASPTLLAERYGVTPATIRSARIRRTWRHVE